MPRYPDKTPGTGAAAVAVTITIGGGAVVGSKAARAPGAAT